MEYSGFLFFNRQVTIPISGGVQLTKEGTASKGGVRLAKRGVQITVPLMGNLLFWKSCDEIMLLVLPNMASVIPIW